MLRTDTFLVLPDTLLLLFIEFGYELYLLFCDCIFSVLLIDIVDDDYSRVQVFCHLHLLRPNNCWEYLRMTILFIWTGI